ncbi:MAG: hypothetical protein ACI9G1_004915, partial [Pirellulaceae bacterium]
MTSPPNYRESRKSQATMAMRRVSVHDEKLDALGDPIQGIWRDGDSLVISPYAKLPPRCVYTNQRTEKRFVCHLAWHEPWIYILLIAGLIGYFIVAPFMTKRMNVAYYLGDKHLARRTL